jgi:hypothetical protein
MLKQHMTSLVAFTALSFSHVEASRSTNTGALAEASAKSAASAETAEPEQQ